MSLGGGGGGTLSRPLYAAPGLIGGVGPPEALLPKFLARFEFINLAREGLPGLLASFGLLGVGAECPLLWPKTPPALGLDVDGDLGDLGLPRPKAWPSCPNRLVRDVLRLRCAESGKTSVDAIPLCSIGE